MVAPFEFEKIAGTVPGPRSRALLAPLSVLESRGVTYIADDYPIVWESARGSTVADSDGNRYIDLTAAFGVSNVGHANPRVADAVAEQARRLMHGMGDVHPTEVKVRLLEKLAAIAPPGCSQTFLCSTGSEAIEFALKTAYLATGKDRVLAFEGAYHGLSLGALEVCGMQKFRTPFEAALRHRTTFVPFPRATDEPDPSRSLSAVRQALRANPATGALVVEPIQGRAGAIVPPPGFLPGLRTLCDEFGVTLIFDEIFTGFGRTGAVFACLRENVAPDILCIGKALGNGFPISAAVGRTEVFNAWERSRGEALHTSTYLGNPMGCAAALAAIAEMERLETPERARRLGAGLASHLDALRMRKPCVVDIRGRGLFWGIQLDTAARAARCVKKALASGVVILQSGERGDVLVLSPPLTIAEAQLYRALKIVESILAQDLAA